METDLLTRAIEAFIAGAVWSVDDEPNYPLRPDAESLREIAERELHWRLIQQLAKQ